MSFLRLDGALVVMVLQAWFEKVKHEEFIAGRCNYL